MPHMSQRRGCSAIVKNVLVNAARYTKASSAALAGRPGFSALQSGSVTILFTVSGIIGVSQSDNLGLVVLAIAVWQVLAVPPATDYSGWQLLAPLLVGGVSSGLFIAPKTYFIVATVDRSDAGVTSGVIGTMQRVGSAIGIAVTGTVLFGSVQIDKPGPMPSRLAFGHGATLAMAVSGGLAVAAFGLVFGLPRRSSGSPQMPPRNSARARAPTRLLWRSRPQPVGPRGHTPELSWRDPDGTGAGHART